MKIVEPSAELIWITPDSEKVIERAARTCYKSETKLVNGIDEEFLLRVGNIPKHWYDLYDHKGYGVDGK